jgi:hypothetical protein
MAKALLSFLALGVHLSGASEIYSHGKAAVEFVTAEFKGEGYRRLLEPMTQFVPEAVTCASSQVREQEWSWDACILC